MYNHRVIFSMRIFKNFTFHKSLQHISKENLQPSSAIDCLNFYFSEFYEFMRSDSNFRILL